MSQITYADKVALSPQPDVADINKVTNDDMNMIKNAHNDTDNKAYSIGKKLWEGTFTSGEITVLGANNYSVFIIKLNAGTGIYCIGSKNYGSGGVGDYGALTVNSAGYRLAYDSTTEKFSITSVDKGGMFANNQVAILEIYGLF